jgi:type III secretory pathway component EscR
MSNRIILTAILFVMVQTVLMGVGAMVILMTPALNNHAMQNFPPMVAITAVISIVASFVIAPLLRARNEGAA